METGKLRGLQAKLREWFVFLTHSTFSPDEREKSWLNILERFKGNHAMCRGDHPNLKLKVSSPKIRPDKNNCGFFLGRPSN
jgi:hypothetical protein